MEVIIVIAYLEIRNNNLMQHNMKISSLDAISIKKESAKLIKVNTEIREGQAVFIVAQEKFPKAVTKLKNTKYDCFYEDSRIDLFLLELQNYNAE